MEPQFDMWSPSENQDWDQDLKVQNQDRDQDQMTMHIWLTDWLTVLHILVQVVCTCSGENLQFWCIIVWYTFLQNLVNFPPFILKFDDSDRGGPIIMKHCVYS